MRAHLRRCALCDGCDRLHGLEREAWLVTLFVMGQMTVWEVIGQLMVDDAHHAHVLEYRGDSMAASIWVPRPVARWEALVGRAAARGEGVTMEDLLHAVMDRYVPGPASELESMQAELKTALSAIDPDVLDVRVTCSRDALDPEHILIEICHRTAVGPAVTMTSDVEIPADIGTRPRGSA